MADQFSLLPSDAPMLEMIRVKETVCIQDLISGLGVTATAVRQRLDRLMKAELVERTSTSHGRGRPAHVYSLTKKGQRVGGNNFQNLALALWKEIRGIKEPHVRRGLMARIGSGLADGYREHVTATTPYDRLCETASAMKKSDLSCEVTIEATGFPVFISHSCPYPELAEQDRSICSAERFMLEELAGTSVQLSECRLDGGSCCKFTTS
jgi:predicted ArsR family transcriptional regulator